MFVTKTYLTVNKPNKKILIKAKEKGKCAKKNKRLKSSFRIFFLTKRMLMIFKVVNLQLQTLCTN